MAACGYKKIFLKDLAAVPKKYRDRIERLVFEEIPLSENFFHDFHFHKMRGHDEYYRLRVGTYRIGCRITGSTIVFYRVKSRDEIYRIFP